MITTPAAQLRQARITITTQDAEERHLTVVPGAPQPGDVDGLPGPRQSPPTARAAHPPTLKEHPMHLLHVTEILQYRAIRLGMNGAETETWALARTLEHPEPWWYPLSELAAGLVVAA